MAKAKIESLEQLKDQHLQEQFELLSAEAREQQKANALMMLGGIRVADKIGKSIASQVMNAMVTFQREELYRNFGYSNFVEFLENSEFSPMSKNQFYARKALFEAEGEDLFNLMEEVGVSVRTRRLLSAGAYDAISIEGDEITVGDEKANLANMRLVKTLIESFAKDNAALRNEAERKGEQLEKLETKVIDLSDQISRIKNPTEKTEATRLVEAFMDASSALTRLADLALNSKRGPAHDQAESFIRTLWDGFTKVKSAFGRDTLQLEEANVAEGEFGDVVAALNDEELAGLME